MWVCPSWSWVIPLLWTIDAKLCTYQRWPSRVLYRPLLSHRHWRINDAGRVPRMLRCVCREQNITGNGKTCNFNPYSVHIWECNEDRDPTSTIQIIVWRLGDHDCDWIMSFSLVVDPPCTLECGCILRHLYLPLRWTAGSRFSLHSQMSTTSE